MSDPNQCLLHTAPDGAVKLDVFFKDETVWLTQKALVACDPKTGASLWFFEGLAEEKVDLIYASPVVSDGIGVAFTRLGNGPAIGFKLGGPPCGRLDRGISSPADTSCRVGGVRSRGL